MKLFYSIHKVFIIKIKYKKTNQIWGARGGGWGGVGGETAVEM